MIPGWPEDEISTFGFACFLLDYWNSRPDDHGAALDQYDERFDLWSELVETVEDRFDSNSGTLDVGDLAWLLGTRDLVDSEYDWAYALAWGIDLVSWDHFPAAWLSTLGDGEAYVLKDGDAYPVSDWVPDPPVGEERSTRPSASETRRTELPHIRRWSTNFGDGIESVDVIFHWEAEKAVLAAGESAVASTVHPNATDEDFRIEGTASIYPVTPKPGNQGARIVHLLSALGPVGPGLVVGGEVCLTDDVLAEIQHWLDATWNGPAIVVAGSMHTEADGEPSNVAFALRRKEGPLTHRKMVPFESLTSTSSPPRKEGISPAPRVVHVWMGDWVRFAILVCRDVLDSGVRHAVARAGVNLLAVPTFTDDSSAYTVHAGSLSLATQGRVVIANNPAKFEEAIVHPRAIFGQPVKHRSVQSVDGPAAPSTGTAIDHLGQAPVWVEIDCTSLSDD